MSYPRNPQREEMLINQYIMGHTIKQASIITGIPAGTISYYFKKFKKSQEYYSMRRNAQTPPRYREYSENIVNKIVKAQFNLHFWYSAVGPLIGDGKYTEARNFLESMKILDDYEIKLNQLIRSATPEEREMVSKKQGEAIRELVETMGYFQRTTTRPDHVEETLSQAPEGLQQDIHKEEDSSSPPILNGIQNFIQILSVNDPELISTLEASIDMVRKAKDKSK